MMGVLWIVVYVVFDKTHVCVVGLLYCFRYDSCVLCAVAVVYINVSLCCVLVVSAFVVL